jgi:TolA-binding protein
MIERRSPAPERPAVEHPAPPAVQAGHTVPPSAAREEPLPERVVPRASAHRLARVGDPSRRAVEPSTLAAEVSRIDIARIAVASGDFDGAIRLIERYHGDFPEGALSPDADVVALEAAVGKHDRAEVAERARRFLTRYPNDPHAARVRWLTEHPVGR